MRRSKRDQAGQTGSAAAAVLASPHERYRFVAPQKGRAVVAGLLLAMVVLTAYGAFHAASDPSPLTVVGTVVAALTAVSTWAFIQVRVPQVVTIQNSIIEIKKSGHVERFDLVDPSVEVLGRDGEMAFRCYDGRFAVVRASDVEWKTFTDVVMHYQNHADVKAEQRQDRFSR